MLKARSESEERRSPRLILASCRWLIRGLALLLLGALGSGCCTVPVSVGNPIPGMTTVAVVPFFNLSTEPSVDGRRFALAYYSELQKTSNYQVIPVGIVETAIQENELNLTNSADAVKLARILEADAVVVGAVTEYNPYYPPQLAVHIRWFSPREWKFYPGISTGEEPEQSPCPDYPPGFPPEVRKPAAPTVRGQSPDENDSDRRIPFDSPPAVRIAQAPKSPSGAGTSGPPAPVVWPPGSDFGDETSTIRPRLPGAKPGGFCAPTQPDSVEPIMSYTRFFDGADRQLIQALRGYYVLRGDMRSGGWEAYLHRSDDFLRFASHVLVVEMLTLHGGPLKTEKIFLYGN
jgi:hypothetical protein